MMRRAERPFRHDSFLAQNPRHGMNFCNFERFLERHIGQNGRDRAREHGFSATGRPDEEDIVSSRDRHLQRAFRDGLSLDEGEIALLFRRIVSGGKFGRRNGLQGDEPR